MTEEINKINIKHKIIKFKKPILITIYFDNSINMYWSENKEYAIHGYGKTIKEAFKDVYYGLKFQWEIVDMDDSELAKETIELKNKFKKLIE